jgi:predicted membrane channel-forming protein YqfA (hemolysin III family)
MELVNVANAVTVGTIIALFLEWFPGVKDKWKAVTPGRKQIYVALGVLVLNTLATVMACTGLWAVGECAAGDWEVQLVSVFVNGVIAIVTSQGVYMAAKDRR